MGRGIAAAILAAVVLAARVASATCVPTPEVYNGLDDDCDGLVDEAPDDGGMLCPSGEQCVVPDNADFPAQCAPRCDLGATFVCYFAPGTTCELSRLSPDGGTDQFCVLDVCADCHDGGFEGDAQICGTGTPGYDGEAPACHCEGEAGCVVCDGGWKCQEVGIAAGQCQPNDNCYEYGCPDGFVCRFGVCVDNVCDPDPCAPDEVCRPASGSSTGYACEKSCDDAKPDCGAWYPCRHGKCFITKCWKGCAPDEYCPADVNGGSSSDCAPIPCEQTPCTGGKHCDRITGQCGDDPCAGVVCPAGELCREGECGYPMTADAGPIPDASLDGAGAAAAASAAPHGGCACSSAPGRQSDGSWLLLLALIGISRRTGKKSSNFQA